MQPLQLITVEDRTDPGTLNAAELFNLVWALDYQAKLHYGRSSWVRAERAPTAHIVLLPHDGKGIVKPPPGAWNLILLNETDEEGALGYHDDAEGTAIPYSDVFVKTAKENGKTASAVASHEMLEMLVDPDVHHVRTARHAGKLYIMEVCDACEGEDYDVGAPEGRKTGMLVSNFVEPAWFGLPQQFDPHSMTFRPGKIHMPFQLGPEGYISIAPENRPEDWTPIFGDKHPTGELPVWASRLPKIHGLR